MAIFSNEFLHRVSAGKIQGASIVRKFGQADIGSSFQPVTDDNFYRTPTTATLLRIRGGATDLEPNIGAWTVEVFGIGSDWKPQSEVVALNGVDYVNLLKPFIRVFRMRVVTSGSYGGTNISSHSGTIQIREQVGNTLWGTIRNYEGLGIGTSLVGAYTVPLGYNAHIIKSMHTVESGRAIDLSYFVRENANTILPPYSPVVALDLYRTTAECTANTPRGLSTELRGACDIMAMARLSDGLGGTAKLSVAFDILLLNQC